jgi:hypothetical protein
MGFLNYMKKLSITYREIINELFHRIFIFNEYNMLSNFNNKVLDEFEKDLFFGIILEEII